MWHLLIVLANLTGFTLADRLPARFSVDLDLPPGQRWNHVFKQQRREFQAFYNKIQPHVSAFQESIFGYFLNSYYYKGEIVEEIAAASYYLGVPENFLRVLNFYYEINVRCTSIVARKKDGAIILGRDLDYDDAETFKGITIDVDFYRDNKLLYTSTTGVGFFGALTAIKPGAFAVSINQRNGHQMKDLLNMMAVVGGYEGNTMILRRIMETANTYEEALNILKKDHVVAYSYVTIAGVSGNQGAIVTRDRNFAREVRSLSNEIWFLVQTNYDSWEEPPVYDNRRDPAIAMMKKAGVEGINEEVLERILTSDEVYRPKRVVYSSIANVKAGYFKSVIRGQFQKVGD